MLQDRSSELEVLGEGADSCFQVSSVLGGVIPCQMSRSCDSCLSILLKPLIHFGLDMKVTCTIS